MSLRPAIGRIATFGFQAIGMIAKIMTSVDIGDHRIN
jgi:hypothetical protein